MSIAPAGSSSNSSSVHKKNQDKPLTLSSEKDRGQGRGGGVSGGKGGDGHHLDTSDGHRRGGFIGLHTLCALRAASLGSVPPQ